MKKQLLIILLVVFTGAQLSAFSSPTGKVKKRSSKSKKTEQVRFGVRAGLNLANMEIKDADPAPGNLTGFHFGGMVTFALNENIAIESGMLYSGKGSKTEFSVYQSVGTLYTSITGDVSIKPAYLEVPINAQYRIDAGVGTLILCAGPYLGFGIGGKYTTEYSLETNVSGVTLATLGYSNVDEPIKFGSGDEDQMKAMDLGLNIGAGFEISGFQIRAQYGLGLSNLSSQDEGSIKNRVIGISAGYFLGR